MSQSPKKQPADSKTADFRQRKKALEAELQEIEQKLGSSVENFRSDVEGRLGKLRPTYWLKKHPAYSISAALLIGFLLAPSAKAKRRTAAADTKQQSAPEAAPGAAESLPSSPGVTALVASEVKRMIARKATSFIVDKLEDFVDSQLSSSSKTSEKTSASE